MALRQQNRRRSVWMGLTGETKRPSTPEHTGTHTDGGGDDNDKESFSDHSRVGSPKRDEGWLAGCNKGSNPSSTHIFGTNQRHAVPHSSHSAC